MSSLRIIETFAMRLTSTFKYLLKAIKSFLLVSFPVFFLAAVVFIFKRVERRDWAIFELYLSINCFISWGVIRGNCNAPTISSTSDCFNR